MGMDAAKALIRSQVAQHGEHPPVVPVGGGQTELREDAVDVLLHRALANDERGRDGCVRPALGY